MSITSRSLIWSRFYPLDVFLLISTEIFQKHELLLISYAIMLLRSSVKVFKIALLGPYADKTRASMSHSQNQVQIFFSVNHSNIFARFGLTEF